MSLNKNQFEILNKILNELNLKKNDKIHLSLDLMKIFLNLNIKRMSYLKFSELILKLIRLRIGKNGIIAVPVFNFSCITTGKFNRIKTPGETGAFGNFLLKKYYKNRSYHPINSFLIFGKNGSRLIMEIFHKRKFQTSNNWSPLCKIFYDYTLSRKTFRCKI